MSIPQDLSLPCGFEFRGSHGPYHCHKTYADHLNDAQGHEFMPWERRRDIRGRRSTDPDAATLSLMASFWVHYRCGYVGCRTVEPHEHGGGTPAREMTADEITARHVGGD